MRPFLQPDAVPDPLEGAALVDFLQGWVVGCTGMKGENVRPRWQPDVPNLPQSGATWAAVGITKRPADDFPYKGVQGDAYTLQRNETITLLCSFYDLGDTGEADAMCSLLRDNAIIDQNRDYLAAQGMKLVSTDEQAVVPVLVKSRWQYRVDMTVVIRRQVTRVYDVPSIDTAQAQLNAEPPGADTLTLDLVVDR